MFRPTVQVVKTARYLDIRGRNLEKVGNRRDGGRGERAELRSAELPFLRTCLAASSSYPTDYERLFFLFLASPLFSVISVVSVPERDDTVTTTMPIAITTVSASKVGTTFDAPTSWTSIANAFLFKRNYVNSPYQPPILFLFSFFFEMTLLQDVEGGDRGGRCIDFSRSFKNVRVDEIRKCDDFSFTNSTL